VTSVDRLVVGATVDAYDCWEQLSPTAFPDVVRSTDFSLLQASATDIRLVRIPVGPLSQLPEEGRSRASALGLLLRLRSAERKEVDNRFLRCTESKPASCTLGLAVLGATKCWLGSCLSGAMVGDDVSNSCLSARRASVLGVWLPVLTFSDLYQHTTGGQSDLTEGWLVGVEFNAPLDTI